MEDDYLKEPDKPRPYIRTVIEAITSGYYAWAEVVGTKVDGYWVRIHFREYQSESEMCAKAVGSLQARLLNSFGISGVEWDKEVRCGSRD